MVKEVNGKTISIPAATIQKFMKSLDITEDEAISLYLDDIGATINAEQTALTKKAEKAVKSASIVKARKAEPKTQTERVKKPDEVKESIIKTIAASLSKLGTVTIVDERKILTLTIDEQIFKIDLTRTRQPKK